jgi:hypothetical protein
MKGTPNAAKLVEVPPGVTLSLNVIHTLYDERRIGVRRHRWLLFLILPRPIA